MQPSIWLQKVKDNAVVLESLVARYHPAAKTTASQPAEPSLPITAAMAEAACEVVRASIRRKDSRSPSLRFSLALATGDIATLASLLSGAWFGVPESRSCWSIPGFSIAVDLLDDPPDLPEITDPPDSDDEPLQEDAGRE